MANWFSAEIMTEGADLDTIWIYAKQRAQVPRVSFGCIHQMGALLPKYTPGTHTTR